MSSKTPSILIGIGSFLLICGILLIAAAAGGNGEESALLGGASVFSTGAVILGLGFYFKARAMNADIVKLAESTPRIPKSAMCEVCSGNPALITCGIHRANLCSECMVTHYDARSCNFAPFAKRAAKAATSR